MVKFESSQSILSTVKTTLQDHCMVHRGSKVVVGVSGGPDSVALLHVLNFLATEWDLRILVAHLDHSLRTESPQDANFVKLMAEELGLEFRVKKADVKSAASRMGVSIEEAGRRCRYTFFEEVRESVSADVIATAHHRDDELETFFLRICRGSSLKGLCGIPAVRGSVVRPLIRLCRKQILQFLQNEGITYRIDQTNLDYDTDRNFVRNRLLPVIGERFPNYRNTLSRTIVTIGTEENFLEELASSIYHKAVSIHGNEMFMEVGILRGEPTTLAARVIMRALYDFSGPEVRWAQSHLDSILRVLWSNNPSAEVTLPHGMRLCRQYEVLRLAHDDSHESPGRYPITVNGPEIVRIADGKVTLNFRVFDRDAEPISFSSGTDTVFFDVEQADFPLVLRLPQPGDRFRPWGLKGTRKVKKILIDEKVPLRIRKKLPLLVKADEIIWIVGIRRSDAAPVESATRRVMQVSLLKEIT